MCVHLAIYSGAYKTILGYGQMIYMHMYRHVQFMCTVLKSYLVQDELVAQIQMTLSRFFWSPIVDKVEQDLVTIILLA